MAALLHHAHGALDVRCGEGDAAGHGASMRTEGLDGFVITGHHSLLVQKATHEYSRTDRHLDRILRVLLCGGLDRPVWQFG